ncbi:MAG: glucosamine-6-phosphate deaminase [Paenibacillaceae bacterium]
MTKQTIINQLFDQLQLKVFTERTTMGEVAALEVADRMKELLKQQCNIRVVFAAAPSQNELLQILSQVDGIDWSRVTVFHMDEYIGLPDNAPEKFGKYLCDRLFDLVRPGQVHLIDSSNDPDKECIRYGKLLSEAPIDIVCLGIGENGHIAFNDPPLATFSEPDSIKKVELTLECRQQQVNDGCFTNVDSVPKYALTVTIPVLMAGSYLFCIVPGKAKKAAVRQTLHGPITKACPSSILRTHGNCTLYADTDSYEM